MELKDLLDQAASSEPRQAAKLIKTHSREGLSQAYFDTVLSLSGSDPAEALKLTKAWRAFRYSDDPSLVFRAKGVGERLQGKWKQSAESFQEAGRLSKDSVQKHSFRVGAVDSLARAGMVDEAVALGVGISRSLKRLKEPELAARAELNVGNALLWADRYAEAKKWLASASAVLADSPYGLEAASALLGLSTANLFGGDLAEAERFARNAKTRYEELELPYFSALCDINIGQVALLQGRADEALDILIRIRPELESSPTEAARVQEFIGDAYNRLNLHSEAADSFEAALAMSAVKSMPFNQANCHYGRGVAQLAIGDYSAAIGAFRKAQQAYERMGNAVWAEAALVGKAQALRSAGRKREAHEALESAVERLKGLGSSYHHVECLLAAAESRLQMDMPANDLLTTARREIFKKGYVPFEWKLHSLHAQSAGTGRMAHYRRMFEAMLNGRLLLNSASARMSFLHDKADALRSYLSELLQKPNARNVNQAVDIIRQVRAASLLDELIASTSLSQQSAENLHRLREELNALTELEAGTGAARGLHTRGRNLARLQRRWIEATWQIQQALQQIAPEMDPDASVFIQTDTSFFVANGGKAEKLGASPTMVEASLKWLQFELMAPMADKAVQPTSALEMLEELRSCLVLSLTNSLCPEGTLWRVPWQVLFNLGEPKIEPVLMLSPVFDSRAGEATLTENGAAMLWFHEAEDLPNVRKEADLFLRHFPNAKVCHTAAEARESLAGGAYDIIHVATHARVNYRNPMFSFLEFADGPLYATEIAKSGLRASIVTLSACETGSLTYTFKEEPDGLVRSFLARGARAVVASAWPLDDEAALNTMEPFYGCLSRGKSVAFSLGEARQKCREWNPHPYYWGPLVIYAGFGNYSATQSDSNRVESSRSR